MLTLLSDISLIINTNLKIKDIPIAIGSKKTKVNSRKTTRQQNFFSCNNILKFALNVKDDEKEKNTLLFSRNRTCDYNNFDPDLQEPFRYKYNGK